MPRGVQGNRAIHLVGNVVPESLRNISVHEHADIYEEKLEFWDGGHDHTGGRNGAVINADTTSNLIYNGNFEYMTKSASASGAPDFWNTSGNITVMQFNGGYWGNHECYISSNVDNPPIGTTSLWQDIPAPSGMVNVAGPSGSDFRGQNFSFNCYASGVGTLYLGIYDGVDHWGDSNTLTSSWNNYKYTHLCSNTTDRLRVLLCVNGYANVDGVQGVIGTRSPSGYIRYTEVDSVAWQGVVHLFNNTEPDPSGIRCGDVVVLADDYGGCKHSDSWGARSLGITLSPSASGSQVPVMMHGIGNVNIYGTADYSELLYAGYQPDCSGYAVSDQYIDDNPSWGYAANMYPIGYSIDKKTTNGTGSILAYISPVSQILITGIQYGVAFAWNFKMVDSVDFATPEVGLTIVCTVSKDGAAFVALEGDPVPSEIGYGWYRCIIPASDMAADTIVLRATAVGAAQTDRSIYTVRDN